MSLVQGVGLDFETHWGVFVLFWSTTVCILYAHNYPPM